MYSVFREYWNCCMSYNCELRWYVYNSPFLCFGKGVIAINVELIHNLSLWMVGLYSGLVGFSSKSNCKLTEKLLLANIFCYCNLFHNSSNWTLFSCIQFFVRSLQKYLQITLQLQALTLTLTLKTSIIQKIRLRTSDADNIQY